MFKGWHFQGLQWKIVLLYTLLVFFALQLIGVYLVQSLEQYYLRNHINSMENQAQLLASFLAPRVLEEDEEPIGELVEGFRGDQDVDIIVLDRHSRVLGTSGFPEMEGDRFLQEEITRALGGTPSDEIRVNPENEQRYYYLAYPIENQGTVQGVVHLSGSLESMDQIMGEIRATLISGSFLVLAISIAVGIMLARTITGPIREVTKKAANMAQGDFSQRIKSHSEDEIGHLAQMFNYLASRLNTTLQEISAEKSKVEALLYYMNDGIVAFDGEGRLIHLNPAAQRMLSQVLSIPLNEQSLEQKQAGWNLLQELIGEEVFQEFEGSREPFSLEVSWEQPAIALQVSLAPFQEEQGQLRGVLLVLHDITQEKEMIQRQQEFVANVSHELKTPLTSIKSYLEALQDGAMEDPQVRYQFLDVVSQETDRMVTMVKDLLELSRIDYRSVELNRKRVVLLEVVEEAREKFTLLSKVPSLYVDVPPWIEVNVDRERVYQVLVNLLNNAIKYTPPQGWVEINAYQEKDWIQLSIKDSGIGIPPEEIHRVFDRFYRVDKGRSRDYGGTGLGLSICKKVVEAHGGKIWMESEVDRGTTVWLTLPAAD